MDFFCLLHPFSYFLMLHLQWLVIHVSYSVKSGLAERQGLDLHVADVKRNPARLIYVRIKPGLVRKIYRAAFMPQFVQECQEHAVPSADIENPPAAAQPVGDRAEAVDTAAEYIIKRGVRRIVQLPRPAQLERPLIDLRSGAMMKRLLHELDSGGASGQSG